MTTQEARQAALELSEEIEKRREMEYNAEAARLSSPSPFPCPVCLEALSQASTEDQERSRLQ